MSDVLLSWSQRDGYTEQPYPEWLEWVDDDRSDASRLRRVGYEPAWMAGEADNERVTFYQASPSRADRPLYLVIVEDPLCGEEVAVWSRADMMALRDVLFARFPVNVDIEAMARKAFRAWHGHYADGLCYHCDPIAFRREQDRMKSRAGQP